MPVAVNCCVEPTPTVAVAGVTAIEVRVAAVTVKVAEPVIVPEVAVMVVVPTAIVEARPPLATVATDVEDEAQVAVLVRFCVVPLL